VSGGLIFGAFAYNLQIQGPLLHWDVPLAHHVHKLALNSPKVVKDLMVVGFYIGKEVVIAIAIALICYYLYKRFWRELAMVAIGFGGGGALWFILSRYFDRPRPVFDDPIWKVLNEAGFPSGHTLTAVVSYGFLAYIITARVSSRFWFWTTIVMAIAIMLFIGCSRLFLGDHYLTDILAGYALGLFWAGLVYTAIEVIFDKSTGRLVSA
jgi:undecaprenyl-diphosphatase